jgi:hypothetical protein
MVASGASPATPAVTTKITATTAVAAANATDDVVYAADVLPLRERCNDSKVSLYVFMWTELCPRYFHKTHGHQTKR